MIDAMSVLQFVSGTVGGGLAGWAYFRGLWWSTQRAVDAESPAQTIVLSFLVRGLLVAGVIAALFAWSPLAGYAAVVGFLVARRYVVKPVKRSLECD